jgi:hypothetical protein
MDPTTETHSWINQYKIKPLPTALRMWHFRPSSESTLTTLLIMSLLVSPVPQDIRISRLPISSRLSPASVDVPGDDIADVAIIRDHWVRQKARQTAGDASHETLIKFGVQPVCISG